MSFASDTASPKAAAGRRARLLLVGLAAAVLATGPANALVFTYDNTTAVAPIAFVGSNALCDAGTGSTDVLFSVADSFTVATISVGMNASHTNRGQIRALLVAPGGTSVLLAAQTAAAGDDPDNDYDVYFSTLTDGGGTNPLDDADADPTTEPFFHRLVNGATNFFTGSSVGTWRLRLCDRFNDGSTGTFNRARLVLTSSATFTQACTSRTSFDFCPGCAESPPAAATSTAFPVAGITTGGVTLTSTSTTLTNATGTARNFTVVNTQTGGEFGYFVTEFNASAAQVELVRSETNWAFSPAVLDLQWVQKDEDRNTWEDYIRVRGLNGGAEVRYNITTSAAPSYVTAGEFLETDSDSTPPDTFGNAFWNFSGAVSSIRSEYWSGDDFADPAQQFIGYGAGLYCAFDFGDAPNTYGTLFATGARHALGARDIFLGSNRPDGESDGQPAAAATTDDTTAVGGVDDEDSVSTFPSCPGDGTYSVTVSASDVRTAGSDGTLVGYIDWNRDGDFDNGTNEESAAVTVTRTNADPSNYTVSWSSVPSVCGGTTATFARFRYALVAAEAAAPTGLANSGEVEDFPIAAGTLPVTVARVESSFSNGQLAVRFTTATETANAGFRVWGINGKGGRKLLARVKTQGADSFVPQEYETTVSASSEVSAIEIEDLSLFGETRRHGPFAVGRIFGEDPGGSAIDWTQIKAEAGVASTIERMVAAESGRALAIDSGRRSMFAAGSSGAQAGLLLVRNEGIHRVTHEQLLAAGVDLTGVPPSAIALLDNGAGVPRFVSTSSGLFGPGSFVEFAVRPRLTLASPVDVLVLKVTDGFRDVIPAGSLVPGGNTVGVVKATDVHAADSIYSFASPNGDPWYEQDLLAFGSPASLTRTFDLPDLAAGRVSLDLRVWGYGDFPGTSPDHHMIVTVNGVAVANATFDGVQAWNRTVDVTGLVTASGNRLDILVPGDTGFEYDYIAFDGFATSYSRQALAIGQRFQGVAAGAPGIAIGGFAAGDQVSIWKTSPAGGDRGQQVAAGNFVSAAGAGTVYAAAAGAVFTPAIVAGVPEPQKSAEAQYLIVTHPVFASSIGGLVALEEGRGYKTEVVTTDRIFAAYSDHASSAEALKSFLTASLRNRKLRYVLLVGADTTDPYDHLGLGSVSYVPTEYLPFAQFINFSPTDEKLVDSNHDGLGDVPIGRLPVRTASELEAMVAKLQNWELNLPLAGRRALLASGASDADGLIARVNLSYQSALPAYKSTIAQVDSLGLPATRTAVLDAFNNGMPLVSFVGHTAPGQWDFTPVLRWQDVASLTNSGRSSLVTQWGCWNSYYVQPAWESLSARLLRAPGAGAVSTIGATTLTSESSHELLGKLFFSRVNAGARTLGDAFRGAKLDLLRQGGAADAVLGMTLLGDPAMTLPSR